VRTGGHDPASPASQATASAASRPTAAAIAAAAWHDRGDDANMDLYRMNVFALDGTPIIRSYRWSEWLDSTDDGSYDTEP
jgi:hypothetical protein